MLDKETGLSLNRVLLSSQRCVTAHADASMHDNAWPEMQMQLELPQNNGSNQLTSRSDQSDSQGCSDRVVYLTS